MYVRLNKAVTFLLLLPQLILHFETVAFPLIFNCFNIQEEKKANACFKLHKKVKTIKLNYLKIKRNIGVCVCSIWWCVEV